MALFLRTVVPTIETWFQTHHSKMLYIGALIGLAILFFVYVFLPLIYYLCPIVQKHLVFQFWVNIPSNVDYNYPDTVGIKGVKNTYLESEAGVTIGVWHILPKSALVELDHGRGSSNTSENLKLENCYWQDATQRKGKGIIIYLHGNTGTRALEHRVELYKILQKEDFHVFTFDYRGYGDSISPYAPTETGVITDAHAVYKWILSFTKNSNLPVFIWGHSLGTGVALSFFANKLSITSSSTTKLSGLFLEAPFSSFADAVQKHRFSLPYRFLPAFQSIFISPLIKNDIAFESNRHIANTSNVPVLVLHSVDDHVIPFSLGLKLYKIGKALRDIDGTKPIYFKKFGHGYAHKHIYKSPELPSIINEFVTCCTFDEWPCHHKFDQPSLEEKVPSY